MSDATTEVRQPLRLPRVSTLLEFLERGMIFSEDHFNEDNVLILPEQLKRLDLLVREATAEVLAEQSSEFEEPETVLPMLLDFARRNRGCLILAGKRLRNAEGDTAVAILVRGRKNINPATGLLMETDPDALTVCFRAVHDQWTAVTGMPKEHTAVYCLYRRNVMEDWTATNGGRIVDAWRHKEADTYILQPS